MFSNADSASFSEPLKLGLLTVGHGTLSADVFAALLRDAGIARLVDVRTIPKSRHNPQFVDETLAETLKQSGIAYTWEPRLGGLRGKPPGASPDVALRNASFRNYAAHMRAPEFREALAQVLEGAARERTAIMCSESLWWRCHRRMIADHLTLLDDISVLHLMHDGKQAQHVPTSGVRVSGNELIYDVTEQPPLPL